MQISTNYVFNKLVIIKNKMVINKKLLISGASGFIGMNLVLKLLNNGYKITAINRTLQDIEHQNFKQVLYSGKYDDFPSESSFDGVIHLATLYLNEHTSDDIPALINANLLLGVQLLEYATNNNIGFFINTATFSQSITGGEYMPQSLYAATKQAMEDLAFFYHSTRKVRVITIELCDTYGENDNRRKFLKLAVDAYKEGSTFKMSAGKQQINYTYIDDVTNGFVQAVKLMNEGFEGGKFSVRSQTTMLLFDLVMLIGKIAGKNIEIKRGFYPYRPGEIMEITNKHPILPGWVETIGIRGGLQKMLGLD